MVEHPSIIFLFFLLICYLKVTIPPEMTLVWCIPVHIPTKFVYISQEIIIKGTISGLRQFLARENP